MIRTSRLDARQAGSAPALTADVVVLYIAGSGRSGSTLLERILGGVPGFVNVGELIDLPRRVMRFDELCGCGRSFSTCDFWAEVGLHVFGRGGWDERAVGELHRLQRRVARQRHLPRLAGARADEYFQQERRQYGETYASLYRAIAATSGARVVVDASKGAAHALALSAAPGVDLRLLHLIRDARGVAFSWAKSGVRRPQSGSAGGTLASFRPHLTAARWAALQVEITAVRHLLPGPSAPMRYEDLVGDPLSEVSRALQSLDLAVDRSDLQHIHGRTVDLATSHGLSGNPSRMQSGQQRLRLDEQWRSLMPMRDRVLTTAIAALPLAKFGYLPAPRREAS